MNVIGVILLAIVLIAMVGLVFWLPFAIMQNMKKGGDYRQELAKRLELVQHGEMLKALGINVDQYLHETRIADVYHQLKACNDCENLKQCEDSLSVGKVTLNEVTFCENHRDLLTLKAAQDARAQDAA